MEPKSSKEPDGSNAQRQKLVPSGRQQRLVQQQQAHRRKRFLQIISGVLVVVIATVGILVAVNRDSGSGSGDIVAGVAIPDSVPVNGLTIGSPDAPLKLTEYGDYQCPFCAEVNNEAFSTLLTKYIETGQVSITFSPMAFLGRNHDPDESTLAVEAALCANDQGKFWPMHEVIYANHNGENQGNLTLDRLKLMAQMAGLDADQFSSCMANGTHTAEVTTYNQAASAAGVNSTPTFLTNTGETFGWTNLASLESSIDAALAKVGS
ncbi:MAG: DsbA family protein [Thermomicrobiales bacterium]